jgi:outer membrane protein assembly factor BamB
VVAATAGRLAAYDVATGARRWLGPAGKGGYSSPQLATIDGVEQILLLHGAGVMSVAPADGKLLWEHAWPGDGIVQPTVLPDGGVLIGSGSGYGSNTVGMRRIAVAHGSGGWTTEERWTSAGLKPYYNDFVVHEGYAYGFDGSILACIDLQDGKRKWKGGRYGFGQVVLLREQGLLLVLSEQGELALVQATPEGHKELARRPAMDDKTWNHPVVAGGQLFVRNASEMVAFRLGTQQ